MSGGSTRAAVPVGSGSVTSVPAMAATAPSGHHATPRMAYVPIADEHPEPGERRPGVVRAPRRAMSTTTDATDAKNRMPGTLRSEVGCHSLIRPVTSGLIGQADRVAPHQRPERGQAGGGGRDHRDEQHGPGPGCPVVDVLEPGEAEDQRPEEEAAVQVRPDRRPGPG